MRELHKVPTESSELLILSQYQNIIPKALIHPMSFSMLPSGHISEGKGSAPIKRYKSNTPLGIVLVSGLLSLLDQLSNWNDMRRTNS